MADVESAPRQPPGPPLKNKSIRHDVLGLAHLCTRRNCDTFRYPGLNGVFYMPDLGCWVAADGIAWMAIPETPNAAAGMRTPLYLDAVLCRGLERLAREGHAAQIVLDVDRKVLRLERKRLSQKIPPPETAEYTQELTPRDCPQVPALQPGRPPRPPFSLRIETLQALLRLAAAAQAEYVAFFPPAEPRDAVGVRLHGGPYPTEAVGAIMPMHSAELAAQDSPGDVLAQHARDLLTYRMLEPAKAAGDPPPQAQHAGGGGITQQFVI